VFFHSPAFAALMGLLVMAQAYVFPFGDGALLTISESVDLDAGLASTGGAIPTDAGGNCNGHDATAAV
jgi:hypothetical protein